MIDDVGCSRRLHCPQCDICYRHKLIEVLRDVLEPDTNTAARWFEHDIKNANQSKFQGIILGKDVSQSMAWLRAMISICLIIATS